MEKKRLHHVVTACLVAGVCVFAWLAVRAVVQDGKRTAQTTGAARDASRQVATSAEIDAFRKSLDGLVQTWNSVRSKDVPKESPSEGILRKIRAAQAIVADQPEPPNAWKWESTRRAVLSFGNSIPIVNVPDPLKEAKLFMSYEMSLDRLMVRPKAMDLETVDGMASLLIHEATHVAVFQETVAITGYSREEVGAFAVFCSDFELNWLFANEALAFRNQAAWRAVRTRTASRSGDMLEYIFEMADRAIRGDVHDFAAFALYSANRAKELADSQVKIPSRECGSPFILQAERHGQPFVPIMIAPDILEPLAASFATQK